MGKQFKIVFHIRPWEVGLYTALENFFSENLEGGVDCDYMTHNFEAEYLLSKKGKKCINISRETQRIQFPSDWRYQLQKMEDRWLGRTRNLMQYLLAERLFNGKSRLYQIRKLYKLAVFYDSYFQKNKPFLMLSNGPDHMAFWLAMDLLVWHGGHPCGLVPVSWPRGHFSMYRGIGKIYYGEELYQGYLRKGVPLEERRYVEQLQGTFIRGEAVPINISEERFSLVRKRDLKTRLKGRLQTMYWDAVERIGKNWYLLEFSYPGISLVHAMRARYVTFKTKRYFNEHLPDRVPFIFFPLHLEPEATTQLYSNYYENQLEVITSLSKSLPVSWVLAVKEHPNMRRGRPLSFFLKLRKLPNVVLISTDVPSWQLIQECRIVATLSGTSGLEASIIGKPVIVFGDPAWAYSPTALKVKSLHHLHETIREADQSVLSRNDERVLAFVLSWVKANPAGIHDYFPWLPPVDDPQNVALIGKGIVQLIGDLSQGEMTDR